MVILKDLGLLQVKFDRPKFNDLASQARGKFAAVKSATSDAPDADFVGLVENSLPTFWHDELSSVFATGGEADSQGT